MPQMYPMNWLLMFLFFITSFYFFLSCLYFFSFGDKQSKEMKSQKTHKKQYIWSVCW